MAGSTWRGIRESISRSEGLRAATYHDALLYTWGIPHADVHGVMRRSEAKALIFPHRSSEARVNRGLDWLIEHKKLCQQEHRGRTYLHWCWWDLHQPDGVKRRRGAPAFVFTCPNETRVIQADPESDSRTLPSTPGASRTLPSRSDKIRGDQIRSEETTTTPYPLHNGPPPPPSEETARSRLLEAVIARRPGAHPYYYDAYTALEEEYGVDFMWACYRAALESGKVEPSAKYLEGIARRCKAEGKTPGQKEDLRDAESEGMQRPNEIDGRKVAWWIGDQPVFDAPAQAS